MLGTERMCEVAEKVVTQVLALKPGETVCILRDTEEESRPFAGIISGAARRAGAEPVSLIIVPRTVGGQELPETGGGGIPPLQRRHQHRQVADRAQQGGERRPGERGADMQSSWLQ